MPAAHRATRFGGTRLGNTAKLPLSYGGVFLMLALLLNIGAAVAYPSVVNSLASCALYAVVYVRLFNARPVAALFFAPVAFMQFTVLISLVAIEGGARMKELGAMGNPSSASAVYAFVIALFTWSASAAFTWLERRFPTLPGQSLGSDRHDMLLTWVPAAVCCFAILILLLKGASTGFPLLMGADRFTYRRLAGDAVTGNLLNLKIVYAAFLGVAAGRRSQPGARLPLHLIFIAYLLVSFLFGDKFFIIIVSTLFYIATQAVSDTQLLRRRVILGLPYAGAGMLMAIVMTVFIYSGNGHLSPEATALRLFDRLASQGQLWFLAFDHGFSWFHVDTKQVMLTLQSFSENPAQDFIFEERLGAFYFVQKYAPSHMYWLFVGNAGFVAPVMALEAYALELFGILGAIPVICLFGILLAAISFWTYRAVESRNPFNALLPAYLYVGIYYTIAAGTPANLFGIGYFKAYAAFGVLQYLVGQWLARSTVIKTP
jgi:hypothetical protein